MVEEPDGTAFVVSPLPKIQQQRPQLSKGARISQRLRLRTRPFVLRQFPLQEEAIQSQLFQQLNNRLKLLQHKAAVQNSKEPSLSGLPLLLEDSRMFLQYPLKQFQMREWFEPQMQGQLFLHDCFSSRIQILAQRHALPDDPRNVCRGK